MANWGTSATGTTVAHFDYSDCSGPLLLLHHTATAPHCYSGGPFFTLVTTVGHCDYSTTPLQCHTATVPHCYNSGPFLTSVTTVSHCAAAQFIPISLSARPPLLYYHNCTSNTTTLFLLLLLLPFSQATTQWSRREEI